jgi:hypothetical protein
MRKILTIVAIAVFLCVAAQAQTTKRDQLVKIATTLEQSPFGETAKDDRGWAVRWVIETDEVSVVICSNEYTGAFLDKKNKYGSELLAQYTIGMAAFKIANPNLKDDDDAAQLAGIESALRAYEAMVAAKPKAKFQKMDDLLAKRASGELTKAAVGGCGKKDEK